MLSLASLHDPLRPTPPHHPNESANAPAVSQPTDPHHSRRSASTILSKSSISNRSTRLARTARRV